MGQQRTSPSLWQRISRRRSPGPVAPPESLDGEDARRDSAEKPREPGNEPAASPTEAGERRSGKRF